MFISHERFHIIRLDIMYKYLNHERLYIIWKAIHHVMALHHVKCSTSCVGSTSCLEWALHLSEIVCRIKWLYIMRRLYIMNESPSCWKWAVHLSEIVCIITWLYIMRRLYTMNVSTSCWEWTLHFSEIVCRITSTSWKGSASWMALHHVVNEIYILGKLYV